MEEIGCGKPQPETKKYQKIKKTIQVVPDPEPKVNRFTKKSLCPIYEATEKTPAFAHQSIGEPF